MTVHKIFLDLRLDVSHEFSVSVTALTATEVGKLDAKSELLLACGSVRPSLLHLLGLELLLRRLLHFLLACAVFALLQVQDSLKAVIEAVDEGLCLTPCREDTPQFEDSVQITDLVFVAACW